MMLQRALLLNMSKRWDECDEYAMDPSRKSSLPKFPRSLAPDPLPPPPESNFHAQQQTAMSQETSPIKV